MAADHAMRTTRIALLAVVLAVAGCGSTPSASPSPTPSPTAVASPEVVCDSSQWQPPPTLTCPAAIAAAISALGPAHPPILRATFRWGGLCPPGAPCAPSTGDDGVVIFDLASGPPVFVYVNTATGGAAAASSPAPYPSGY